MSPLLGLIFLECAIAAAVVAQEEKEVTEPAGERNEQFQQEVAELIAGDESEEEAADREERGEEEKAASEEAAGSEPVSGEESPAAPAEGGQAEDEDEENPAGTAEVPPDAGLEKSEDEAIGEGEELALPEAEAEESEAAGGNQLLDDLEGTGIIQGEVFGPSGEGLPGVVVRIELLDRITRADQEGKFALADLPAGEFEMQFNKLGYKVATRTIILKEGESTTVSQALEEQPVELVDEEYEMDEVEIVGEYVEEDKQEIQFEIETESKVLGGSLGKAEFAKTGVSDAAGAVTKVSGANIVGGKYAVVRGLGDRYTNTTLNGGIVPSADPSRKAVQLDLFPTDLLENVNIYKTFAPDLPAEFVGGLIAVETLRLPDERVFEVSVGTGTHSETHGEGGFYSIPGRKETFFADNNDELVNHSILDSANLVGSRRNPVLQQLAIDARSFFYQEAPIFADKGSDPEWDRSLSIVFGDKFELNNGWNFGVVGSFTHETESRFEENQRAEFSSVTLSPGNAALALPGRFTSTAVNASGSFVGLGTDLYREAQIYTDSLNWGLLLGGTLEMGDDHNLSAVYFKYRSEDASVTLNSEQLRQDDSGASQLGVITGNNLETIGGETYQVYDNWDTMDVVFRDLEIWQTRGGHDFRDGGRGLKFNWFIGGGIAQEARPVGVSQRFYNLVDGNGNSQVVPVNPSNTQNAPSSFYLGSRTQDDSQEVKIDTTLSLWEQTDEDNHLDLRFGLARFNRTRDTTARRLSFTMGDRLLNDLVGDLDAQKDEMDDLMNGTPPVDGSIEGQSEGWIVGEATGNTQLTYSAYSRIYSGYLMGDLAYREWELLGGVRYEREEKGFLTQNGESVDQSAVNFFPGVIFSRAFGSENQFGMDLAWSRTVARPTFYEYVDAFTLDQANDRTFAGNPNLEDTEATNTDFRLSYRDPRNGDSISASLFHKSLTNPIVQIEDPFASGQITWANFESAKLSGVEIDFSKDLLQGFSLFGNVSYIYSDVQDSVFRNPRGFGEIGITSEGLEGQPNWLVNLVLSHDYEPWGLTSSLSYNFTGSYLSRVVPSEGSTALNPQPDNIMRQPFHSLDLILAKSWQGEWQDYEGKVSFKIKNLLGSKEEYTYGDLDILPYELYDPGREYSLSMSIKF
ncbi:outer membrane beta-barrel protein [Roseibacillus ishigakijimensis]|uniref:Outer membrane beta-barrel protein n=1 Tax=Roseibacillus ishigakijimensis TaxID=454146 RepID=A0A934RRB5_9BACT|nr:outer membrane beta-barrel protein [Roseibacillus ishigakijimensis]MBK1834206.1 outer membrane beta-barrel protein [Roseibacillus ishigakijimensis]